MWPWCNLAASQRRPYCASVNSHSPVDWASVLCDRHIHNDRESRSASSWQCACSFYSSHAGFFWQSIISPSLSAPLQPRFGSLRLLAFPKAKAVEREEICECDGNTVHKLSKRRLTADWLHQGHATGSRDIQNGWILPGQASYMQTTQCINLLRMVMSYK